MRSSSAVFTGVGPAGRDLLGAARAPAMQQHHLGVLGPHAVERRPDAMMVIMRIPTKPPGYNGIMAPGIPG